MHDEIPITEHRPSQPRLDRIAVRVLAWIFVHLLLDVVLGYLSADQPAPSSAILFSLFMAQTVRHLMMCRS